MKKDGQSALHYISFDVRRGEGYAEIIYYLYMNGCEINMKDKVLIFIWIWIWMNIDKFYINLCVLETIE